MKMDADRNERINTITGGREMMNESLNWSGHLEVEHRRCECAVRIKEIELQVRLSSEITKKCLETIGELT